MNVDCDVSELIVTAKITTVTAVLSHPNLHGEGFTKE